MFPLLEPLSTQRGPTELQVPEQGLWGRQRVFSIVLLTLHVLWAGRPLWAGGESPLAALQDSGQHSGEGVASVSRREEPWSRSLQKPLFQPHWPTSGSPASNGVHHWGTSQAQPWRRKLVRRKNMGSLWCGGVWAQNQGAGGREDDTMVSGRSH